MIQALFKIYVARKSFKWLSCFFDCHPLTSDEEESIIKVLDILRKHTTYEAKI